MIWRLLIATIGLLTCGIWLSDLFVVFVQTRQSKQSGMAMLLLAKTERANRRGKHWRKSRSEVNGHTVEPCLHLHIYLAKYLCIFIDLHPAGKKHGLQQLTYTNKTKKAEKPKYIFCFSLLWCILSHLFCYIVFLLVYSIYFTNKIFN